MGQKLKRSARLLWSFLHAVTGYAGGFLLVFMALAICFEVVMRYFFGRSTLWVTDASGYILVWATFLVAAWVLKGRGHVRIDTFVNRLNPRAGRLVAILGFLLAAVASGIFVYQTGLDTYMTWQRGIPIGYPLTLPRFSVYLVMPLGIFFLMVQFLVEAWREAQGIKSEQAEIK